MSRFSERHSLKDRVVWITGGKRIGQEIAVALAELGADLILTYRSSKEEAENTAKRVKKFKNKIFLTRCDVSNHLSVQEAIDRIKKEFKKIDILILLASVFKPSKLENIDDKEWDFHFSTHIKGTFWPVQLSLSLMPAGSHIVAVSDRTSIGRIYPGYLPYVVTKSAITAMTRALAVELGPKGIFINSIAPGPILRPDDISGEDWQKIRASSVVKYPITDDEAVREFVDMIIRLCFVRSSGSVYPLDLGHL